MEAALNESITIRQIEEELGRLRHAAAAPGSAPNLRTSVMTHLAWVPERWVDAATDTLAGMGERHPSRTILLFPRPDDPRDALDGEVDLRCFVRAGEQGQVCSEVISLQLCGPRAKAPASVAMPLLIPDLPVFLRWRGEPWFGDPALDQLSEVADRLVLDSDEWSDCDGTFARLPEIFDRIGVSDIAWAKVQPWREACASLWPEIGDAARHFSSGAGCRRGCAESSSSSTSPPARSSSSPSTEKRFPPRGPSAGRPATCSPTSSRSSAATGSTKRLFAGCPRCPRRDQGTRSATGAIPPSTRSCESNPM